MPILSSITNRVSGLFKSGDDEIFVFIAIFLILLNSMGSKSTYKSITPDSNPLVFLIAVIVFLILTDCGSSRGDQEIY